MKNISPIRVIGKVIFPVALILSFSPAAFAQSDLGGALQTTQAAAQTPPQAKTPEELKAEGKTLESCTQTRTKSLKECMKPSGVGFAEIMGIIAGVCGVISSFASGNMGSESGDQKQDTNKMCMLGAACQQLGSNLNGGQNDTCINAAKACESKCEEVAEHYRQIAKNNLDKPEISKKAEMDAQDARKVGEDCIKKATEIAGKAQQQQQANQQPQGGMEQCQQALDSGLDDEEIVDCSLPKYQSHAQCSTLTKTGSDEIPPFARTDMPSIEGDDSDVDLPVGDPNDFGKTASNNGGMGNPNSGGFGMFGNGSNGGSNDGAMGKTAGTGQRGGGGSMYGASGGSGGGGGAWGANDDEKKGGGFGDGKNKLLTKRKLAGHKLGEGEFAASTDDIWVRVYTRTNTNCTKQLLGCAANKSLNPYGEIKNKGQ